LNKEVYSEIDKLTSLNSEYLSLKKTFNLGKPKFLPNYIPM